MRCQDSEEGKVEQTRGMGAWGDGGHGNNRGDRRKFVMQVNQRSRPGPITSALPPGLDQGGIGHDLQELARGFVGQSLRTESPVRREGAPDCSCGL